jgi:gas vesicle protein
VADNSRALAATLVGAVLGGIAGYLFFTEHGRTVRRRIEPALDDVAHELNSFRTTVQKAANVANEGWKLFGEALNEGAERQPRYPTPHQTSPY